MSREWLWSASALVALSGSALAGDPVTIERKLQAGHRVQAQERLHQEIDYVWSAPGNKTGWEETTDVERKYTDELRTAQPERSWREYQVSTRAKLKKGGGPGEDGTPRQTSLHGRGVHAEGPRLRAPAEKKFTISSEDQNALRYDRLILTLVPPQKVVEKNASWEISSEAMGVALYGPDLPRGAFEGEAKLQLRTIKKVKGRATALIRIRGLQVRLIQREGIPGIDLQLKGELDWDLEEGVPVSARLEGKLSVSWQGELFGQRGLLEGQGPFAWSYQAEILEARATGGPGGQLGGEPPPLGTTQLGCERDPAHRYPIAEFKHCIQCGKQLTKWRCAEHGWPFQRCVRDGAPLKPE